MRVRLLGGFDASMGDRHVPPGAWRLRKARTLVKLLALEPGHRMHRDQLIDMLWPEATGDAGRNNLHQVVHAARRALSTLGVDGTDVLAMHDDVLALGGGVEVVTDLEELQAAVRAAQDGGLADELIRLLQESDGELLPEDAYEPWVQSRATAFHEWRTQLVMDVVETLLATGDAETAVVLLTPVTTNDPLHEPAVRAMMRALDASGRRSEALLLYERLRAVLRDELGAEPEPVTRAVFRELLTSTTTGPTGVTIPAPRTAADLPARVTSLVGRDRELSEIRAILARSRLLTLTGMGGAGKTTLAVELARGVVPEYAGGVHLVELGALSSGEQVAPQVLRTLQLEVPAELPPLEALVTQLRGRRLLIVLDNCEHLLEACARLVADLLRGCPDVSVLATSREPLRIDGEVAWRTPSLGLPEPAAAPEPSELARVASVELFVERARAALPTFALTEENAAAVAEICYRLDGIPLALELAAACIPAFAPRQIADRLGDSLNLLRRGSRAGITRQQTLEATLGWSHDLLSADERVLFRRLSTFAGSFGLDAVEQVCGAGLDAGTVLTSLARLVDTSLVTAETRDDVVRYRMLDTVRQYATERLRSAGEQRVTQERHCDWFLRFAQSLDPERATAARAVATAGVDVEHDNLRAALSWSLQHRPEVATEFAVALWRYWLARGFFAEGRRWLEAVLAADPAPTARRARALLALAAFDVRRGSGDRLVSLAAESVRIREALDDPAGLAEALHADAALAYMRGRWDEAWQRSGESWNVAGAARIPQLQIAARYLQALVLTGRGLLPEAEAAYDDVRTVLPTLDPAVRPFLSPILLGFALDTTNDGGPRVHFEETVYLGRLAGVEQAHAYVLCNLADVRRLRGDFDGALALLREASDRFVATGDADGEALAASRRGSLHRVRGEFDDGRAALTHSLRLRRALGDRRAIGLTQSNLGLLAATEGDVATAYRLIEQVLVAAREMEDGAARVGVTHTLASVYADAGDYEAAHRHLVPALLDGRHIPGNSLPTAWGQAMLADILSRLGRADEAVAASLESRRLLAQLGAGGSPDRMAPGQIAPDQIAPDQIAPDQIARVDGPGQPVESGR